MPNLKNLLRNQQGITPVLVLSILTAGIIAGMFLIKNPTFFHPKADFLQTTTFGSLVASPNPCAINPATGTCTSKMTWDYAGKASDIRITFKEAPNLVFSTALKASQDAPWIGANGITFEVYSGNTLIDSLFVQGTTNGATTSATSGGQNTCVVAANKQCSIKIKWDFGNTSNVRITIKENPGSLFALASRGEQTAPWITEAGATFEAYSGTTLLGSVFVKGVKGTSSTTIPVVMIPSLATPTPTPVSPVTAATPPPATPTPAPASNENPAYHYHYNSNN